MIVTYPGNNTRSIVDIANVLTMPGVVSPDPKSFPASVTTAYPYIVISPVLTSNFTGAGYTIAIDGQNPSSNTNYTLSPSIGRMFTLVPTLMTQGSLVKCVYDSRSYSFNATSMSHSALLRLLIIHRCPCFAQFLQFLW